jgi:hypothetical protein
MEKDRTVRWRRRRALGIPARLCRRTVPKRQTFIAKLNFMAYPSSWEFRLRLRIEPLDLRPVFAKE